MGRDAEGSERTSNGIAPDRRGMRDDHGAVTDRPTTTADGTLRTHDGNRNSENVVVSGQCSGGGNVRPLTRGGAAAEFVCTSPLGP